jgi:hypothetical protein
MAATARQPGATNARQLPLKARAGRFFHPAFVVVPARLATLRHLFTTAAPSDVSSCPVSHSRPPMSPGPVARTVMCWLGSLPTMEQALLRLLVERDPVLPPVLSWIVTGTWPPEVTAARYDVSFLAQSGPQPF